MFANNGWLVTPHLAKGEIDWMAPQYGRVVLIKLSTLNTIRKSLCKVVEVGTGYVLNGQCIPLAAGKTGIAEDSTEGPDHAWFGCYAPYPEGKIVVVAFAQNTPGGGSVHALPVAKKVLAAWEQSRQKD